MEERHPQQTFPGGLATLGSRLVIANQVLPSNTVFELWQHVAVYTFHCVLLALREILPKVGDLACFTSGVTSTWTK